MTGLAKWLIGTTMIGTVLSNAGDARTQYLTGEDRNSFVAGVLRTCIGGYGTGSTSKIPKPLFEQYCRCYANGLADRIPVRELKNENDAIISEEGRRCYEAIKEEARQKYLKPNN